MIARPGLDPGAFQEQVAVDFSQRFAVSLADKRDFPILGAFQVGAIKLKLNNVFDHRIELMAAGDGGNGSGLRMGNGIHVRRKGG